MICGDLVSAINDEFSGDRPDVMLLFNRPHVADDEGCADFFGRHQWSEVSASDLKHHEFAVVYFSRQGFLYFLPAYLKALVEKPNELDSAGDAFLNRLMNCCVDDLDFYLSRLTDQQMEIVVKVIAKEWERQGGWEGSAMSNDFQRFFDFVRDRCDG